MNVTSLSERLRAVRKGAGLSLEQLAHRMGYSKSHVANVEAARSQPSGRYLENLADAVASTVAMLTAGIIPMRRSRRPKLLTKDCQEIVQAFGYARPRVPLPSLGVAFRAAGQYVLGPSLLQKLDEQPSRPAPFWDAVKQVAGFLNGLEQVAFLHLLDGSSELKDLHPHRLGLRLSVVAECGRRWLAVVIRDEDDLILFFPQLLVLGTSRTRYCLDFLAAVRRGERTSFIDVELDGRAWHTDAQRELAREEDLGLPTLRFDQTAVDRPDFRNLMIRGCWRLHDRR